MTRPMARAVQILALTAGTLTSAGGAQPRPASQVNLFEAQTLLFLSPEIQQVVHQGMDVALVPDENNPAYNNEAFFHFRVGAIVDAPSNLVGYYAVNRYTADVLSTAGEEFMSGPELDAVRTVIRKVHGIDSAVIKKHRTKDWAKQ